MYGIVANVISDRVLRTGAKVWIHRCNGDAECPIVSGISKSGARVEKYTRYKRLTNYRAACVPKHMRSYILFAWPERAQAEECADLYNRVWAGLQLFNRDGSVKLAEGVTVNEAFKRFYDPLDKP